MTPITSPAESSGRREAGGSHLGGLEGRQLIRFEQAIDIDRTPEEVFAYLADFTNIPRWNYYVEQVSQLTPGPVRAGTIYDQIRRTDRQRFEVAVYQAPKMLAVTTLPGEQPAFHRHFSLEPAGAGTRLSDRWELDLGYMAALQRLATPGVKSAVAENLAVLKQLLEQGSDE
jgi:Polyketide cyclase / dehydrase and lipid transport